MLGFIITTLIIGVFAGYLARFLVPRPDLMSVDATIVLGIDEGALQASGIPGAVIGALISLLPRSGP